MTLEYHEQENGQQIVVMTVCPACGHRFRHEESRSVHIAKYHTPEDFGLSRPTATDRQVRLSILKAERDGLE